MDIYLQLKQYHRADLGWINSPLQLRRMWIHSKHESHIRLSGSPSSPKLPLHLEHVYLLSFLVTDTNLLALLLTPSVKCFVTSLISNPSFKTEFVTSPISTKSSASNFLFFPRISLFTSFCSMTSSFFLSVFFGEW